MNQQLAIPQEVHESLNKIAGDVLAEVEIANDFQITDDSSAQLAGEQLSAVSKLIKRLDAERLEFTRPYDTLKADIMGAYSDPVGKLTLASNALRSRLQGWLTKKEAERAEAMRIERVRIHDEQRAAEARFLAERERAEGLKTATAQAKAVERIAAAETAVMETSVATAMAAPVEKIKGFGMRKELVVNYDESSLEELVKAAAANPKLLRYLAFATIPINKVVKSLQSDAEIPGLRLMERTVTVSR